jgi:hypothetical protein
LHAAPELDALPLLLVLPLHAVPRTPTASAASAPIDPSTYDFIARTSDPERPTPPAAPTENWEGCSHPQARAGYTVRWC